MKIGPLELRSPIQMQARNGAKPSTAEVGQTGTSIFSGQLSPLQDYNDLLNPPQCYATYDKMRLGDPTVAAALRVMKQPLLNAEWKIDSASDDARDKEIADFLELNLKEGMTRSWRRTLRQMLRHLDYGNQPFEKCWRIEDGKVLLRKLAPRHPASITRWLTDENGGLKGIEQTAPPDFTPVEIDVSKLVVFVNDEEDSNFHGISILRAAYKPWMYVDGLERVESIGIEKRANGVDAGKLMGEGITEARRAEAEKVLQSIHAHQKMYVTEIEGQFEYKIKGIEGDVIDPDPAIRRHQLGIVRSMLTEFLTMGSGSTGSLAMHKDKSSMTMLALGGTAQEMCDTFNMHVIKPWVDYNWNGVTRYPKLKYTHLDARPLAEFAEAMFKFSQSGMKWTIDQENAARALLDVPALSEEEFEAEQEDEIPEEEPEGLEAMPTEQVAAAVRAFRAELRRRREPVNA